MEPQDLRAVLDCLNLIAKELGELWKINENLVLLREELKEGLENGTVVKSNEFIGNTGNDDEKI